MRFKISIFKNLMAQEICWSAKIVSRETKRNAKAKVKMRKIEQVVGLCKKDEKTKEKLRKNN